MKISFVIPCYRSEHTLRGVVDEIKATVLQRPAVDFEIVLVDDCSPDGVWNTITELVSENSNIKAIQFTRNFGQHAALMAGFSHVDGDIVFSLDDDGQAPVDELWKVIDELDKGFDLVYGEYPEIKQNAFRRFGSWFNCKMNEALLGWPKGLHGSSFYACRRIVVDEAVRYDHPYPYVGGLLLRVTKKVGAVEVHQRNGLDIEQLLLDHRYAPERVAAQLKHHNAKGLHCSTGMYLHTIHDGIVCNQESIFNLAKLPVVKECVPFYKNGDKVGRFGPKQYAVRYYLAANSSEEIDATERKILREINIQGEHGENLLWIPVLRHE